MARFAWDGIGWFYYHVWWAYLFSLIPLIISSFSQGKTSPASDILHPWRMSLLQRNLLSLVCKMGMTPINWKHCNELTGVNYAAQYKILKQQNNFHFCLFFFFKINHRIKFKILCSYSVIILFKLYGITAVYAVSNNYWIYFLSFSEMP